MASICDGGDSSHAPASTGRWICFPSGTVFIILLGCVSGALVSHSSLRIRLMRDVLTLYLERKTATASERLRIHVHRNESVVNSSASKERAFRAQVHEAAAVDPRKSGSMLRSPTKDSWDVLRRVSQGDAYACKSSTYDKHVNDLPPLLLGDLLLPPGTRTLFYGHSFLGELMLNLLYAHSTQENHTIKSVFEKIRSGKICSDLQRKSVVESLEVCSVVAFPGCDYFESIYFNHSLRWRFRNNVEVISVLNHGLLQNDSSVDALAEFMSAYGPFDHAFFMQPHPPCFFKYMELSKYVSREEAIKLRCVNMQYCPCQCTHYVKQLWEVISNAVAIVFQVPPWSTDPGGCSYCAPQSKLIYTRAGLLPGCAQADCKPRLDSHQCLVGRLTLLARDMVNRLYHRL